ncbi:MAG: ATP-binding cassette domain-containing protein [Deltaproteobacteria bacterium]|nr:ATP-binding cassette domain-containing protein [Deltaproteobacteria bacterium]
MIAVTNLEKRFGSVVALQGVSFTAPDGLVTGLLGPNGAGKTTALRILCTLMRPDAGDAVIDGHDVVKAPMAARVALGVLPDSHGLYPRLTAREHVRYAGALHGLAKRELEARVDAVLASLDMGSIADRRTEGFSQGETMKVALARALVHDPKNVVLDEPTRGLDVMSTRALRDVVRRLRAEGRCVLFSSHVMQEVAALCDRVVVVARGRVVAEGTPSEMCAKAGKGSLEDAFVTLIGSDEGLMA